MKTKLNILLISILLAACKGNSPKSVFDFPANGKPIYALKSTKTYLPELLSPYKIEIKQPFLIIFEDGSIPFEKSPMHLVDLNTLAYRVPKGVNGYGPNEITNAQLFDTGFSDSTFWVNSSMSKRMSEFSLYDSSLLSINEYRQPEDMYTAYQMLMITDSTFMCLTTTDNYKLVEYGANGKRITGYGKWEPIPNRPELTNFMLTSINGGWFKKDSWNNLFVKAMAYRDRIEIFDYNSKQFITVDGPRLDIPPFQIGGSGAGAIAAYSREVKFGHRDIAFGKQFIYDLYGGFSETEYRQTSRLAETIYILTKKGELVAKLDLDRSLRSIAVDESLGKIYGITTDEDPGIAVFDIPKELLNKN